MIWGRLALLAIAVSMGLLAQEKGDLTVHLILHAIGSEHYELTRGADGSVEMTSTISYSDRGNKTQATAALAMKSDYTPERFEVKGKTTQSFTAEGSHATVRDGDSERKLTLPASYFVGTGARPFAVQMMMMRYWARHGKPAALPIPQVSSSAGDAQIRFAGRDSIHLGGKNIHLDRYTVGNIVFGREVLWMNDEGHLAALMTFAGGLPFEAVRTEYEPALPELFRSGVAEELKTLEALGRQVPPEKTGSFAIVGATLVDATGRAPVPDSVLIVRDGRIAAAGPRSQVAIAKGIAVVDARGQTLLPGLWEMHTHYTGVEFGPAYLAAGVTTARDCGGEFELLVAMRDAIDKRHGLGPRLLLAGLIDAGPDAFGAVTAETPEQARAVVARYQAANFQQLKLYTYLEPEIIRILSAEAHRMGMTVTGHVPRAVDTFQGIEDGMDQINHLNYVSSMMRPAGSRGPIDFDSEQAHKAIAFLKEHNTVVDPTASWGEMAGHSKDVAVASFEPGISKAPYTLSSKYLGLGAPATESERYHSRMKENIAVIGALHRAGVTIVPGSDTGLLGYGLHRELELYVQAGMTPLEAIQSATIVSARAMKLDREVGTVEPGKRADLILVDGNPLENISDIRKVSRVVANGWMYSSAAMWSSVGFQ